MQMNKEKENWKAVQKEYELDDKTMEMVIASTPNGWNEFDKLAYMDYAASQIKGFKDNMKKHMGTMKAKKKEVKEMKEKEYVLGQKINKMIHYYNPRNLKEATEEDLNDENIYTISEKKYNDNKELLIQKYNNATNNNGGSTDYYKLNKDWVDLQDVIEERGLNFAQGNILKAAWCLGSNRHAGTNYVRELNKIMWFCQRELERVRVSESDEDEQEKFFKSYGRK